MRESDKSWQASNDFLHFADVRRYTKIFARYDLFRATMMRPGDIVECGVFKGSGVLLFARWLEIFCPQTPKRVIGFDTFDGYPETDRDADKKSGKRFEEFADGKLATDEEIWLNAKALGIDHRISLVKGDATETIPQFAKDNPGFRISLLNLDFDTHDPTKVALEEFFPRVVTGGVVAFDEYAQPHWGESDAVDNYFKDGVPELQSFPWVLSPTAYMVKGM